MPTFLSDFRSRRPEHESTQEASLSWLAQAHTRSLVASGARTDDAEACLRTMEKRLQRFGCSPRQIRRRGHETPDCTHTRWSEMSIYDVTSDPAGAGAGARTAVFASAVERFFEEVYAPDEAPPKEIVHVSCTGYVAPSGAQRLVARRGWGTTTRVTHAYHMGCYAALPAVRIAAGQLALEADPQARVDIAHTELCSLHMDPTAHDPEQLVVQSLFADGYIRYSLSGRKTGPALRVLAEREEILADSAAAMSWTCSDHAMKMSLSRDVPERIAAALTPFLGRLHDDAGLSFAAERARSVFALHPGGPRILDVLMARLELEPWQLAASRATLLEMGNMSSATLPHVWRDVLADPQVPTGTLITTLAFGPGLTCAGALLRKE
jgi:predicted naringenin-chalcone synthase